MVVGQFWRLPTPTLCRLELTRLDPSNTPSTTFPVSKSGNPWATTRGELDVTFTRLGKRGSLDSSFGGSHCRRR